MLAFTKPNSLDSRHRAHGEIMLCEPHFKPTVLTDSSPKEFQIYGGSCLFPKTMRRGEPQTIQDSDSWQAEGTHAVCKAPEATHSDAYISRGQEAPLEPQLQPALSRSDQLSSRRTLRSQSLSTTKKFLQPVSVFGLTPSESTFPCVCPGFPISLVHTNPLTKIPQSKCWE